MQLQFEEFVGEKLQEDRALEQEPINQLELDPEQIGLGVDSEQEEQEPEPKVLANLTVMFVG